MTYAEAAKGRYHYMTQRRLEPMDKRRILRWLVDFSGTNVLALTRGRPGDLPNLIYEIRQWLDLEPDEPLNREVSALEKQPVRLQGVIDKVAELVDAIADRKRFQAGYIQGSVILDAAKLGTEGGRALSYRDSKLVDAALRVAIDDIYEDTESALRIRRCREPECGHVFYADRQNQMYCSHRCANRKASRQYRQTHAKERAEWERIRYERKTREKTGSGVKIERRKRS
jgi:hypothetical protein